MNVMWMVDFRVSPLLSWRIDAASPRAADDDHEGAFRVWFALFHRENNSDFLPRILLVPGRFEFADSCFESHYIAPFRR
jgi:hypothetical protein